MIGQRIQQARKASGLSLRALAEKAGITAMAISKYENNQSTPSSKVLLSLAGALGVRTEYFFRTSNVQLQEVEYRKHAKLPKKILDKIEGNVIEQIERFIELEEFLPNSPVEEFSLPEGLPDKIEEYDEIESIAKIIRKKWGLGNNPIPDLIDTLEERGIRVFLSTILHNDMFDGLAAHVNGTPIIVVGHDWPGDRQRFTLSHELGHLLLDGRISGNLDIERAANRFAGAFLVPSNEAIKELGQKRNWLEPIELCVLKKTYGLSMQAWLYRATDLGIINRTASKKMWDYFTDKGWRTTEPGDRYPSEEPKLFIQMVFHACGEELISESKAAELLGKSLSEFRTIRNVGSCNNAVTH